MIIIAALLLGEVAIGQLPVQIKLERLDRTFICPDHLPSDEARDDAMKLFIAQVQSVEPSVTVSNLTEYRYWLLVKHQCTETLKIISRK